MRNPFYNEEHSARRDIKAVEPVPEAYVGDNNPYRGIEQHGVENPNKPTVVPGYGDTYQVELQDNAPIPDPVPVLVVNQGARERRDWAANNTFVDSSRVVEVLPNDPRRTKATIVNAGPNTVYVGRTQSVSVAFGFPVAMGATFPTLEAETNMYAITAATETANLRVLWEYRVTLRNE